MGFLGSKAAPGAAAKRSRARARYNDVDDVDADDEARTLGSKRFLSEVRMRFFSFIRRALAAAIGKLDLNAPPPHSPRLFSPHSTKTTNENRTSPRAS